MRSDTHIVRIVQPLGALTFVYYDEPACDGVAAHCLELDIGGQGRTRDEATKDLQSAIETYVQEFVENEESIPLRDALAQFQAIADR